MSNSEQDKKTNLSLNLNLDLHKIIKIVVVLCLAYIALNLACKHLTPKQEMPIDLKSLNSSLQSIPPLPAVLFK